VWLKISTIIIYAGIVQGLYLAILLNHNKTKNPANKYLSFLFISLAFSIVHSLFIVPEFQKIYGEELRFKEPFLMLIIPLIWLYVKKIEQPSFLFSMKTLLHFIPFVIFITIYSIPFINGNIDLSSAEFIKHSIITTVIIGVFILGQYSVYLIYIFRVSRQYKIKAMQELSNTENVDLGWLNMFLYLFLLVFIVLVVMFVAAIHKNNIEGFNTLVLVVFSIVIFVLGYKGLFQQTIFSNIETKSLEIVGTTESKPNVPKPDEQLVKNLLTFMEEHKPYQDPELSLTSLAKKTGISRNLLSETINNGLGSNFYGFINNYRLEEVKKLMSSPKWKNYTILALAYEAGFQSKSTFNSFFKKNTSITPSRYRAGRSFNTENQL
jgi:AraC-like DNA-binding protein